MSVVTTEYCNWNALTGGPDYNVVSVAAGQSGTGSGVVDFVVAANPGVARRGSLVVRSATGAGEGVLTINQAGR